MKHEYSQIGFNIKSIRKMRGIGLEDFANKVGIGDRALTNIENGTTDLPHTRLEKIAKAFDMSVAELESWHQTPQTNNFHNPQGKFVGVNNGNVHYEQEISKRLEGFESVMARQSVQIEEMRQERTQLLAFIVQVQEQMTLVLKKLTEQEK